jgi:hypothetical protein
MLSSPTREIAQLARVGRSLVVREGARLSFVDLEDRSVRLVTASGASADLAANSNTAFCLSIGGPTPPDELVEAFDDRGNPRWPTASLGAGGGWALPTSVVRITDTHLAITGHESLQRSVVIAFADGSLRYDRVSAPLRNVVEDDTGELDLVLLEAMAPNTFDAVDAKTNHRRWSVSLPCPATRLHVAAHADRIFLAGFEYGDGGGCVVAVDRKDGSIAWKADLSKPPVAHSEYWNDVTLRLRGDEIVAVGREAGAEHVDVFAVANGDRRFAHVVPF